MVVHKCVKCGSINLPFHPCPVCSAKELLDDQRIYQMKLFTKEDFEYTTVLSIHTANVANDKFNRWLYKQIRVYGSSSGTPWHNVSFQEKINISDTHQAYLVGIEEIKKCEHPKEKITWYRSQDIHAFGSLGSNIEYKCTCGARVRPSSFEEVTD